MLTGVEMYRPALSIIYSAIVKFLLLIERISNFHSSKGKSFEHFRLLCSEVEKVVLKPFSGFVLKLLPLPGNLV